MNQYGFMKSSQIKLHYALLSGSQVIITKKMGISTYAL